MFTSLNLMEMVCKSQNKYGLFISFSVEAEWEKIFKSAPYLSHYQSHENFHQCLFNCEAFFLFDTEEEMDKCFNVTICDCPNEDQTSVYAISFGPEGILSENT